MIDFYHPGTQQEWRLSMIHMIAGFLRQPCQLCDNRATQAFCFETDAGAEAGQTRFVYYALCRQCAERGRQAEAEEKGKNELRHHAKNKKSQH